MIRSAGRLPQRTKAPCAARMAGMLFASLYTGLAPAHLPPRIEAQRSHAQCPLPGQDAQAVLLDDADAWGRVLAGDAPLALGREVDWRSERILVVALAQQRTGGIRVRLADAVPHAGRARLLATLEVTRPGPEVMAPMVLTRPCVVAAIVRGGWKTIDVQTESGRIEARRP